MYIPIMVDIFIRELNKLTDEINLYQDEKNLWKVSGQVTNSAGNLTLHICGNLQHFIGSVLGNTGYERNRDLEFSAKDVSRVQLLLDIEKTKAIVESTLKNLHEEDLNQIYPLQKSGKEMNTAYLLTHLLTHLNYHIGQINYHRRMI